MSAKQAATYHGADIVTRLRVQAPYSDDGQAMVEAAQEIEKLRGAIHGAYEEGWDSGVTYGHFVTGDFTQKQEENPYRRSADV